jgi:hypothetical protein
MRGGKMIGNQTIRRSMMKTMLKTMSAKDAAEFMKNYFEDP